MRRAKAANAKGEFYGEHKEEIKSFDIANLPNVLVAITPILIVLVLNFVLSKYYFATYDGAYLEAAPFNTKLASVKGMWSLIVSLVVAIIATIVLNYKRFNIKESVNKGAYGSMLAILNTASEVGYGNVIKTLGAFAIVQAFILGISDNPLISEAISVNVLAGITGSASGGMSIALGALGKQYMEMALAAGINPEALHRIAAIACGGLDSLPHNGAVITLLGICGLTHKESYADIGVVSVLVPLIALIVALVLASIGLV
jgi:H+/gluconate symporter-like permease